MQRPRPLGFLVIFCCFFVGRMLFIKRTNKTCAPCGHTGGLGRIDLGSPGDKGTCNATAAACWACPERPDVGSGSSGTCGSNHCAWCLPCAQAQPPPGSGLIVPEERERGRVVAWRGFQLGRSGNGRVLKTQPAGSALGGGSLG